MSGKKGTFDMLNDALFAQMERLADASGEDELKREIERSEAVSELAGKVVDNARTAVNLMRVQQAAGMDLAGMVAEPPKMLGGR